MRCVWLLALIILAGEHFALAKEPEEPVVISGEAQYVHEPEQNRIVGTGKILITYHDVKLTCDKVTFNTRTQDTLAEGNVVFTKGDNVITGNRLTYNFKTGIGSLSNAKAYFGPWYGHGSSVEKVAQNEFEVREGYVTTCDLEKPHYRIASKTIRIYLDDRVVAENVLFLVDGFPLFYIPRYSLSLKEKFAANILLPGNSGEWGYYVLAGHRYYFNDAFKGYVHLDYREKQGIGGGFDTIYDTRVAGKGVLRVYGTQAKDKEDIYGEEVPGNRYRVQLRHKWSIDERTDALLEFHKSSDRNFIKEYYLREEFEKDAHPPSYLYYLKKYDQWNLSVLGQKRVNDFETVVERLPEIGLNLRSRSIGDSNFYYRSDFDIVNLTKKFQDSSFDDETARIDAYNHLDYVFHPLGFVTVKPYAGVRQTWFSRSQTEGDEDDVRGAFYSGADLSMRFHKMYNIESNPLGIEVHGLRHIITPIVNYEYVHEPTIGDDQLTQFDDVDALNLTNHMRLGVKNKLKTKQGEGTQESIVDLATLLLFADYEFPEETGSGFKDILADLELRPSRWMRIESDARYDTDTRAIHTANFDFFATGGDNWEVGIGDRYVRNTTAQLTTQFACRVNPRWKFRVYGRYDFEIDSLEQQEYTVTRDLHCWVMDVTFSTRKSSIRASADTIWLIFRLKAFPEVPITLKTSYGSPKQQSE
jgi:lipopolysaccharide assembly outer membrane protein LptD (OstA)